MGSVIYITGPTHRRPVSPSHDVGKQCAGREAEALQKPTALLKPRELAATSLQVKSDIKLGKADGHVFLGKADGHVKLGKADGHVFQDGELKLPFRRG